MNILALPETNDQRIDVRAYCVGLVMQTVTPNQVGAFSVEGVISRAEQLAQYIATGEVKDKKK